MPDHIRSSPRVRSGRGNSAKVRVRSNRNSFPASLGSSRLFKISRILLRTVVLLRRTACTDRTSFHQRAMSGYPYGGGYAAQHQQPRGAPERGGWQQPAYGAVQQPAYGAVQQTAQITQQQNSTSKYSAPPGWTVHESQGHPYWANTTTGPSDA